MTNQDPSTQAKAERDPFEIYKDMLALMPDDLGDMDNEIVHHRADTLLLEYLRATDHAGIADAWERLYKKGFWYA